MIDKVFGNGGQRALEKVWKVWKAIKKELIDLIDWLMKGIKIDVGINYWSNVSESHNEPILSPELNTGPFRTTHRMSHGFFLQNGWIGLFGNIFLVSFSVQTNWVYGTQ